MSNTLVYSITPGDTSLTIDFTSLLGSAETVTSLVIQLVSPLTSPALSLTLPGTITSPTNTLTIAGGLDGITYGVQTLVGTSTGRTFPVTLAILCQANLNVPYANKNPYAFQSLVGSIESGDAAIAHAFFVLPSTMDVSTGYVTWDLIDQDTNIFASGNAYDYRTNPGSMNTTVEANAVVNVPSTVPPTLQGQRYQLRWSLILNGSVLTTASENIEVTGLNTVPLGTEDAVELAGDICNLSIVVDRAYSKLGVEIYKGNQLISPYAEVPAKWRVSSGWMYQCQFDTSQLSASLDPYTVMWKYMDANTLSPNREGGRLYLLNPTILSAVKNCEQMVAKARTTLMRQPDMMFDTPTIVSWLQRGRDMFNGAGGFIVSFDMTNATGSIREFWLRYSEVAMLRAQALAEGEKAFQYSGQSIQLDVDRAQYYQQLADNLEQTLDNNVPALKKNLQITGAISGDGDMTGVGTGPAIAASMGAVGIGWNAISPQLGNGPYGRPIFR